MNNIQLHPHSPVKTIYRREITQQEVHRAMGVAAMSMCVNDLLTGLCVDAANKIKATPYYKHKVKKLTNTLMAARQRYDLSTMSFFKRDGITVLDFFDAQNGELSQDIEMLRINIKNDIDKANVPYSNELSYLMLAEVMGHYASGFYDMAVRTLRMKAGMIMSETYNPHSVWQSITALIREFGKVLGINALKIEMSECVLKTFDILTDKLQDLRRANNNLQSIYDEKEEEQNIN